METVRSYEIFVTIYWATRSHSSEDHI